MSENTREFFRLSVAVPGGDVTLLADRIGEYMERWLLMTPWGTLRLHHILRSDDDRELHDHPWDFVSLLLSAGYEEQVPARPGSPRLTPDRRWEVRTFLKGETVRHRAEDLHRLEVPTPAWTLVLTGPTRRSWGFLTEYGWMHYKDWHRWIQEGRRTCGPTIGPVFADGSDVPLEQKPPRPVAPEPALLRPLLRLRDRLLFGVPSPRPSPRPSPLRRTWDSGCRLLTALFAGQDAVEGESPCAAAPPSCPDCGAPIGGPNRANCIHDLKRRLGLRG